LRVTDLLKWKRALNEIKFKHEELEIVKEINSTQNSQFGSELREYCAKHNIDLAALIAEREIKEAELKSKAIEDKSTEEEETLSGLSLYLGQYKSEAPPEIPKDAHDEEEMHKVFKDLFKKIVLHLHPDRLQHLTEEERQVRLNMFKEARRSIDDRNYFKLLEISELFNIKMPKNYKQQTRWMKGRIKELEREIAREKNSYNYLISEAETQERKDELYKNFLRQIFQI
jgi:hypothetical protein